MSLLQAKVHHHVNIQMLRGACSFTVAGWPCRAGLDIIFCAQHFKQNDLSRLQRCESVMFDIDSGF